MSDRFEIWREGDGMSEFTYTSNTVNVKKALKDRRRVALEAVGVFVEGEAVERAPILTGNLKGSINHVVVDDNEVNIGVKEGAIGPVTGTPVDYAVAVEMGTSRTPEQPFLRPAVDSNMSLIVSLFEDVMRDL